MINIQLKTKFTQGIGLLVAISIAAFMVYESVDFFQTRQTHAAFSALLRADSKRMRMGDGLEATEAYVAALRAVDLDFTHKELRPAFAAYIAGFEEGLMLAKSGKPTAPADAKIKKAHEELTKIAEQYD